MSSLRYSRGTPIRSPFTPRRQAAAKSGTARSALVESLGSCPAIEPSMMAQSSTVRATGPAWSSEEANATIPHRLHRPYVGLMPAMPQKLAGWRIEPPVSVAVAPSASRAATAAAEPPEEPPGTSAALLPCRVHGLVTGP